MLSSVLQRICEHSHPSIPILGVAVFIVIFHFIIRKFLIGIQKQFDHTHEIWKPSFVTALYKPLIYSVWVVGILLMGDIASYRIYRVHLPNFEMMLSVVAVLTFSWFLIRWNFAITQSIMREHLQEFTPAKLDLLHKLGILGTIILTLFLLMDVTGRNLDTLIAFGGIGGIALAFASQQFVSNLFGGLNIYITKPFSIGDSIELPSQNVTGIVEEIGWYATCVRNIDKRPIYIPNSVFNQSIVVTPSRMSHNRLFFKILIRPTSSQTLQLASKQIKDMLSSYSCLDQNFPINVVFNNFINHHKGSFLELEISAYTDKRLDLALFKQEILLKSIAILDELSIRLD